MEWERERRLPGPDSGLLSQEAVTGRNAGGPPSHWRGCVLPLRRVRLSSAGSDSEMMTEIRATVTC